MGKQAIWFAEPVREKPRPRIYFARAIDGEDNAARSRLASTVASELAAAGLSMVDPAADDPAVTDETKEGAMKRYRTLVEHDLSVLQSCHAVLMDISVPGRSYIGCICEMTYAYFWKIPCVVYTGNLDDRRPWLQYHATAVLKTRADAIDVLRRLLKNTGATPRAGSLNANMAWKQELGYKFQGSPYGPRQSYNT
jgi:hypothetical protein